MTRNTVLFIAIAGVVAAAAVTAATRRPSRTEVTDFAATRTTVTPAYDAALPPVSDATTKVFRIPITHDTIEIADGTRYEGWTFGGTVPGPVIRVRQGDRVKIVLVNRSLLAHSIDFHAARIPMNQAFRSLNPGDSLTFEFQARDPGTFMVHCGTPPVLN